MHTILLVLLGLVVTTVGFVLLIARDTKRARALNVNTKAVGERIFMRNPHLRPVHDADGKSNSGIVNLMGNATITALSWDGEMGRTREDISILVRLDERVLDRIDQVGLQEITMVFNGSKEPDYSMVIGGERQDSLCLMFDE